MNLEAIKTVLKTFIKHIFTEADNTTFDVTRVGYILGLLAFIGLSVFTVIKSGAFDFLSYGTGLGALLGGGGAGVGIKSKMEAAATAVPPVEGEGEGEGPR